jgi:hypothetical protein
VPRLTSREVQTQPQKVAPKSRLWSAPARQPFGRSLRSLPEFGTEMPLRHSRGPSALKPIKHIFGKVDAVRFCSLLVSALASRNTIAQLKVRASNVHVRDLRDFVFVPRSEGLLARKFWWGRLKLFGLCLIFWLPRMRSECPSGLGKGGRWWCPEPARTQLALWRIWL